ncbi:MAG: Vacuolar protein sorting-associated protein 17 [Thelocarpon impressellum]|nr:MAG: Vacuolar protein sorting-associated protein 17 [Thelocarpon impressellum]
MDYSSLPGDSDQPTGSSPWASPQPNSAGFSASSDGNPPSSPLRTPYTPDQRDSAGFGSPYADSNEASIGSRATDDARGSGQEHIENGRESPSPAERGAGSIGHSTHQPPQEQKSQPQRYHGGARSAQRANTNAPQYKLQAKITGLERTGRKDPILRFDVHTNLPKFRTTQFRDVRRTHSEFIKLADHLISSNPEAFVPAVPPPLTAAGAGTDEDEARVKASLQRWLSCVCSNDVLMRDEEMVLFVEGDFGYSPVVRRKQPATGVRRRVIKQFAPPPDDTPELQDARPIVKLFYLGTMEAGQKVDRVVKARRSLGLAESDLGVKLGIMHVQETHPGLRNAYRKLGKTIQTTGDYHAAQGTAEATTLGDPLQYHSSDAFIVKETLTNRHILLRDLLQAQQSTRSRMAATDRLKASTSVKRDKVDEAINALDEARSNESYLSQKTQRVTANLLQERRRWFARTAVDMRQSIREYVLREIEAERRTLATLESVRPDIRAIDASGGLSRLGREAHPAARRASLAASQGPKGDAWSGVPRRAEGVNRSISGSLISAVPEADEDGNGEDGGSGRARAISVGSKTGMEGLKDEDDDDRIDAKNAASRLATSTF